MKVECPEARRIENGRRENAECDDNDEIRLERLDTLGEFGVFHRLWLQRRNAVLLCDLFDRCGRPLAAATALFVGPRNDADGLVTVVDEDLE